MNYIICHYGELALKGGNRDFFEKQLIFNIKKQLNEYAPGAFFTVHKKFGRIIIEIKEATNAQKKLIKESLMNVFGLVSFAFAEKTIQDIDEIKKTTLSLLEKQSFDTFKIATKRSQKNFPLNSEETCREVGAFIVDKLKKKVKLNNPDITCYIEIAENYVFIFTEKIKCLGGMPIGVSGKALCLLSGGIDSPVASFYALKRGLSVRYIHFHSIPYTSKESVEKVRNLTKALKKFQSTGKIYLIPFAEAQKQIMINCPESLRVILYRRMMLKIAEKIARKEKAKALVTGDSLAQVASQTLENLFVVGQATEMLLLRPLIGFDKEDIMNIARKIGTYETSILPHDDCCTRLMPKKPETRADIENVLVAEKNLDTQTIISDILKKVEIISI